MPSVAHGDHVPMRGIGDHGAVERLITMAWRTHLVAVNVSVLGRSASGYGRFWVSTEG